jgi:hypothetical protein
VLGITGHTAYYKEWKITPAAIVIQKPEYFGRQQGKMRFSPAGVAGVAHE